MAEVSEVVPKFNNDVLSSIGIHLSHCWNLDHVEQSISFKG